VYGHRNSVFSNIGIIEFCNCIFSTLLLEELNVTKASALSVSKNFEFARANFTVRQEQFHKLLLVNVLWQISDNDIGFAVEVLLFLLVEDNLFSIDTLVIHFIHAPLGLILIDEVEVSETK
jgi:hypothetical protein